LVIVGIALAFVENREGRRSGWRSNLTALSTEASNPTRFVGLLRRSLEVSSAAPLHQALDRLFVEARREGSHVIGIDGPAWR
jgi:hypothetical protein